MFVRMSIFFFFFFKPKTAYEMRIIDWSSDVCSSDLDSLYRYAHSHQMRIRIAEFKDHQNTLYGDLLAQRINEWQSLERDEGKTYTSNALIGAGIKPWEIKAAMERNARAVHKLTLNPKARRDFEQVEHYKAASDHSKELWSQYLRAIPALKPPCMPLKIIMPKSLTAINLVKGFTPLNIQSELSKQFPMPEHPLRDAWQEASLSRDELAYNILKQEESLSDHITYLKIDYSLHKEAHKYHMREQVQCFT